MLGDNESDDGRPPADPGQQPRKSYVPPRLKCYGSIAHLTGGQGGSVPDGASMMNMMGMFGP